MEVFSDEQCLTGLWQICELGEWKYLDPELSRRMSEAAAKGLQHSQPAAVPQWSFFVDHERWNVELDEGKPKIGHDFACPIHAVANVGRTNMFEMRLISPEQMRSREARSVCEPVLRIPDDPRPHRKVSSFIWLANRTPVGDWKQQELEELFEDYLEYQTLTPFRSPEGWDPATELKYNKLVFADFDLFVTGKSAPAPLQRVSISIDTSTGKSYFQIWKRSAYITVDVHYQELPTLLAGGPNRRTCGSIANGSITHRRRSACAVARFANTVKAAFVRPSETQSRDPLGLPLVVPEGARCWGSDRELTAENAVRLPTCPHWFDKELLELEVARKEEELKSLEIGSNSLVNVSLCCSCENKAVVLGSANPSFKTMRWFTASSGVGSCRHIEIELIDQKGGKRRHQIPLRLDGVIAFILLRKLFRLGEIHTEDDIGLPASKVALKCNNDIVRNASVTSPDYFPRLRTLCLKRGVTLRPSDAQLAEDTIAYFQIEDPSATKPFSAA